MDTPNFDESLRTGNEIIDSQHAWLFELAARVTDTLGTCGLEDVEPESDEEAACDAREVDATADAVYGLADYISEHFGDEEALMNEHGYPGVGPHVALHEALSARVTSYMLKYMNGDIGMGLELADFFREWLGSHILEHDREFTTWLATR